MGLAMIRAGVATLTFLLVCGAQAQARTEFCPARLWYRPASPASTDGRSSGLVFGLAANSSRTIVTATIIADTDGGWYIWDVSNVALTPRTTGDGESTRQVATFGKQVFVRHAWVLEARTSGDAAYGWDTLGDVACGIPSFGKLAYPPMHAEVAEGFPHVAATPVAPPYATDCPHPFSEATVTRAAQPYYPHFAPRMSYTAQIEVAVGQNDAVLDAWVYKSSGNKAVDTNALAAARLSSYASAMSYCRKAEGYYLFRADFDPW
jgi:hypothetical protein